LCWPFFSSHLFLVYFVAACDVAKVHGALLALLVTNPAAKSQTARSGLFAFIHFPGSVFYSLLKARGLI
jgi:hypothetical protein